MFPSIYRPGLLAALLLVSTLAGCETQSGQPTATESEMMTSGIDVQAEPCRIEVDSPADGEVDAVFEVTYDDGRPVRASADYGGETQLPTCIDFGWKDGRLVSKTDYTAECSAVDGEQAPEGATSRLRAVDGSNLVALTFPDGELVYHYLTAPGDFSFLLTRTSYNLGPQKVANVDIRDGRMHSLGLPAPNEPRTVEADYRGGKLVRVSETDDEGEELGYASFHYREGRLVKVKRLLATMNRDQSEEVQLSYDCDDR